MEELADLLRYFNGSCVVHVGAGLSTAAGIRDFRGKNGVWTELQKAQQHDAKVNAGTKEEKKDEEKHRCMKPFDETVPTFSHMALKALCENGLVKHIVSQNVDGLFLKANLKRCFISELHGNFYLDECTKCRSRFIRAKASESMRLQKSAIKCPRGQELCKGYLRDTILDWESSIPYNELRVATKESKRNKLHICLGTSLQLKPSMDLICDKRKSKSSKLVIINLQPTKFDEKADLVVHHYVDNVMIELFKLLDFDIPDYKFSEDPTKDQDLIGTIWKK